MMDESAKKRLKKKLKQFKKDPEAEVYSEERAMWETVVTMEKQGVAQTESQLKIRKALLGIEEKKLKEIIHAEQKLSKGQTERVEDKKRV